MIAWLASLPERMRRLTSSESYVPQLDGLRFFAIMPVLVWHGAIRALRTLNGAPGGGDAGGEPGWLPHGEIGVDLFFVISGYVIARPFLARIEAGRALDIGRFYLRRVLRLEPPYLIVLVLCALAASTGLARNAINPERMVHGIVPPWQSAAASAAYAHYLVFGKPSTLNPPIWSLEVELQFYLVSPLLLSAYGAIRTAAVRRFAGMAAVLAAVVLAAWIVGRAGPWSVWAFSLPGHLHGFLLGIVLADVIPARLTRERPVPEGDALMVAGLALLVASGYFQLVTDPWQLILRDLCRMLAAALIVQGAFRGHWARAFVGAPWISLIGGACYSLYLIHLPLMIGLWAVLVRLGAVGPVTAWPLGLVLLPLVSIAAGLAFYALVERPFMRPDWPRRLVAALRAGPSPSRAVRPNPEA